MDPPPTIPEEVSMSSEAHRETPFVEVIKERARGQLAMLLAQFLVGLAISRIGLPWQTGGSVKIVATVLLALHLITAVGLVVGAILVVRAAVRMGSAVGLAWGGGAAITVTFCAGALTLLTGSDWWSYLMGAGATASLPLYGMLYVRSAA